MPLQLLDLSIDVLELILRLVLVREDAIPLCPCGQIRYSSAGLRVNPLPIMLVHPATYSIGSRIFYQENTFALDLRGNHRAHVQRYLRGLSYACTPSAIKDYDRMYRRKDVLEMKPVLHRIRYLDMRLEELRDWVETLVLPLVRDMILSGSLVKLRVVLHGRAAIRSSLLYAPRPRSPIRFRGRQSGSSHTDAANPRPRMSIRSPVAGVLALLAEPNLRIARLWMMAGNSRGPTGWKPFCIPCPTGAGDPLLNAPSESGSFFVEIDLGRLMEVTDLESRPVAAPVSSQVADQHYSQGSQGSQGFQGCVQS
ncbi:hypothetical protein E4U17_007948 [Claviceps sp. LM77 group G4]|nr:hypothetical protein E4U17_007948 [Claviceps sp. LM77 group G4]KAG6073766.1 hypothetical protein E4U33_002767 [Claviceps sp. LM78 group G4]